MKPRRQSSAQHPFPQQHPLNGRDRSKRNSGSQSAPKHVHAQQQQQHPPSQPHQQHPPPPATPSPAPQASQNNGMSLAHRYVQNLKVLRRNDPAIVSIIDQFSHVCIYHYDGNKWEKKGFEGSFFVFERRAYPPYGFFILNRMGMEDYVQYIHPEDNLNIHGQFLLYRSFPDLTARRLSRARKLPPPTALAPLETYTTTPPGAHPSPDDPFTNWKLFAGDGQDKGRAETVGLWMHETGGRDVKEVMKRLHECVVDGRRYPDEFRTTPDVPPDVALANGLHVSPTPTVTTNGGVSELDKLFSKLAPTPSPAPATPAHAAPPPAHEGKVTLADLFASASASAINTPTPLPALNQAQAHVYAPMPPSAPSASRGIALLDSIFASATPAPTQTAHAPYGSKLMSNGSPNGLPAPGVHEIHSPKPAVAALPQILTQDVITHLLLGTPPPTEDVAGSEGLDANEADTDAIKRLLQLPITTKTNGFMHGDLTPRAPSAALAPAMTHPGHALTPPAQTGTPGAGARRPLVPFHEDSALWPYPRAPLDDRDDAVVELDFEDTRALSDMDAFAAAQKLSSPGKAALGKEGEGGGEAAKEGKRKGRRGRKEKERAEREAIEKAWDVPEGLQPAQVTQSASATPAKVNGHVEDPAPSEKIDVGALFKPAQQPVSERIAGALTSEVGKMLSGPMLERKAFVREVLTLIHTDAGFVDKLYNAYLAGTGGH
ncbi:hypothetical protein K488DRAFT_81418 [Vararia minispora EC-137]|uniref:Uncharacterized protein n=1 Tax=Vararia minispora EC-137 TaxID=1314806 RepID=A0ACB8QZ80_9AGAM|nr:hypothetical protein K488DRAFT_81418 [Vararia minispora EC-137]